MRIINLAIASFSALLLSAALVGCSSTEEPAQQPAGLR